MEDNTGLGYLRKIEMICSLVGARVEGECHILQVLGDTMEGECCPINGARVKGNAIYYK